MGSVWAKIECQQRDEFHQAALAESCRAKDTQVLGRRKRKCMPAPAIVQKRYPLARGIEAVAVHRRRKAIKRIESRLARIDLYWFGRTPREWGGQIAHVSSRRRLRL